MYWKKASKHKPEANYSVSSQDTSLESKGIRNTKYAIASNFVQFIHSHRDNYSRNPGWVLPPGRMDINSTQQHCGPNTGELV